jgi:hypothetical protein
MKYYIRIFVDGYETTVQNLKQNELKPISDSIMDYVREKQFSFPIEMTRYYDPIALKVPFEFMQFTEKRIHLSPFGFHKALDIQFEHIDDSDSVHYCYDIWCDGYCGTLRCGCIDVCRSRCGMGYD